MLTRYQIRYMICPFCGVSKKYSLLGNLNLGVKWEPLSNPIDAFLLLYSLKTRFFNLILQFYNNWTNQLDCHPIKLIPHPYFKTKLPSCSKSTLNWSKSTIFSFNQFKLKSHQHFYLFITSNTWFMLTTLVYNSALPHCKFMKIKFCIQEIGKFSFIYICYGSLSLKYNP